MKNLISIVPNREPSWIKSIIVIIWEMIKYSIDNFLLYSQMLINFIFIAHYHYSSDNMISIGIPSIWLIAFQLPIFIGIGNGAIKIIKTATMLKKFTLAQIFFRQTILIYILLLAFFFVIDSFFFPFFLQIFNDLQIRVFIWRYLLIMKSWVLGLSFQIFLTKYLAIYKKIYFPFALNLIFLGIHIFSIYLISTNLSTDFLIVFGLSTNGTTLINLIFLVIIISVNNLREGDVSWFTRSIYESYGKFIKNTIPYGISKLLDNFNFVIVFAMICFLKETDKYIAHLFLLYSFFCFWLCVIKGITRKNIERFDKAKKLRTLLSLIPGFIILLILDLLFYFLRANWMMRIAFDEESRFWINRILPIFFFFLLFYYISSVFFAFARNSVLVMWAYLVSYVVNYGLILPLSYIIGIVKEWKIEGIWITFLGVYILIGFVNFCLMVLWDWNAIFKRDKENESLRDLKEDKKDIKEKVVVELEKEDLSKRDKDKSRFSGKFENIQEVDEKLEKSLILLEDQ